MVGLLGGLLLILLFGGFWILGLIRVIMGRIRMVGGSCSRGMGAKMLCFCSDYRRSGWFLSLFLLAPNITEL